MRMGTKMKLGKKSNGDIIGPPKYTRKWHKMEHFGDVRFDPYYWLRERRNPQVRKLLQHENAYMDSVYGACGGRRLCRILSSEMRARWKEEDASLPYRDRGYWYYTRTVPNADYPIYCRRPYSEHTEEFVKEVTCLWSRDPTAPLPPYDDEVVYLDLNLLVKELRLEFVELGDMEVSTDEHRLALALDCSNGKELYTIFIFDITDVNYIKWMHGNSDMHQAWAKAMLRSDQSIYTYPTSCLQSHRGLTASTRRGRRGDSNMDSKDNGAMMEMPLFPALSTIKENKSNGWNNMTTITTAKNITSMRSTTSYARRLEPLHKITRRIDMFDASDEVLWLSPNTLLYLGLDEKMRSCRVIYHDLTAPVDAEENDIICYEESDEAFWVTSLGFSADGWFATFTVASGSCTEVYMIPCDAGAQRCVTGIPIVYSKANEHEERNSNTAHNNNNNCAVYCFADRTWLMDYDVDHHEALFGEDIGAWIVVMTGALPGAEDFRVAYILDSEVAYDKESANRILSNPSQWRPLFVHDPHISVEGIECLRDYLLLSVRCAASSTVLLLPVHTLWDRWHDYDGDYMPPLSLSDDVVDLRHIACRPPCALSEVRLFLAHLLQEQRRLKRNYTEEGKEEGDGYVFSLTESMHDVSFNTRMWCIAVTHLTIPTVFLSCELEKESATLCIRWLCEAVVSGAPYLADDYDATVLWVPSDYAFREHAGTSPQRLLPTKEPAAVVFVPVYVCWKKALRQHGENPMFLTVYGSYGDCCDVSFETERLTLLDRGFVWAAAGVRGGGELGISWRDAGRKLQRATSVNDFVSVSRYVQETGWCAVGRLVTYGSSAGGFVVTAAMCTAPSLSLAVIASVPFVDCLTALLDVNLPLTVCEWEEFGNPLEDSDAYHLLRAMSPIDNIPPPGVRLPHMLLITAWNDTRVGFWESLAFTARLREREEEAAASGQIVLHYCDFGAGHGGATGRYDRLKEIAREYAFAILVQQVRNGGEKGIINNNRSSTVCGTTEAAPGMLKTSA